MSWGKVRIWLATAVLVLGVMPTLAADLQAVQQALSARGYAVGAADGVMGRRTAEAIRMFESDQGWQPTGEVSERLAQALQPPRELPQIVVKVSAPPSAKQVEPPNAQPPELAAVFVNRNWLVRDFRMDGAPAGPAFSVFLEVSGKVAGPRFAEGMRWQADGQSLTLRYESAVGAMVVRTGQPLDANRLAGAAEGPAGDAWRWIAEAKPEG